MRSWRSHGTPSCWRPIRELRPRTLVGAPSVPGTRYGWPEDANRLYRAVEERIAQMPGVSSAGIVWPMPFGGTWSGDVVPSDGAAPSLGREIGIRMALGSARADIVGRVLGKGFALALAGVALGSAASLFLGRFLESLLYGVEPGDPVTLVATASLMVLAGALASWMPAWRAARTDPVEVLRTE